MSVVSRRARLVYVVVPKAACTIVKTMLYDLDVGGDRRPKQGLRDRLLGRPAPGPTSIHQIDGYVTRPFDSAGVPEGFARFAVLRDPLSRLHSAWSNKTGSGPFEQRGETGAILAAGLPVDPTFGEFLEGYERYRALSVPAAVHTRPLRWHLGDDLGWFDRLFRLEAIADLEPWVSERAGVPVRLARENRGAPAGRALGLEDHHIDLARRILADDYALLAGLYDFGSGLADFHRRHALAGQGN
jgi:hypothetical protein